MTVDVLFPYYGDVELMKLAVHSVLTQDYRDFRLIVVDDGYPDESIPGWFDSLGDDRIHYERNETNLGANGNYRKCLAMASNELVTVMGADDMMLPNHLQWLVDSAAAHPAAQIFQPGVFVIDEHGAPSATLVERVKDAGRPKGSGAREFAGEPLATSLIKGNWLYFPSIGWRTEPMQTVGFRKGLNVVQDLALALDLIKNGGSLLLDDRATFCYRRHSGSDSSWRALEGTRFAEEREFFATMAREFDSLGWRKASAAARRHLSSRLYAASLLPKAAKAKQWAGVRNLGQHLIK